MKDSNTPDLFVPAPRFTATSETNETPQPPPIVDTQYITDIYMQRPVSIQNMRLGAWFNSAHQLKDWNLHHCVGTSEARRHILNMGYNRLPLQKLEEFNAAWKNKGE